MENNIMKMLYLQMKFMTVQFYKLNPKESGLSQSYVYAISNDCYPIFHENDEIDLYNDYFTIKKDKISTFVKYLDAKWLNKEKITFYGLENHFGGKAERFNIITMLRYSYLDQRFSSPEFWTNIESDSPIEGKNLNKDLEIWEL